MRESSTQRYLLHKLNQIPYSEWLKPTTTNKAGAQDVVGHIQGYHVAIEWKVPGNKPKALQKYRIEQTVKKGACSFWADNWQDVEKNLKHFAKWRGFDLYSGPAPKLWML